jgi:hypothetical protein
VLDGPLMIGARLLEHLVEEVGTSGGLPRVLVLGGGDKVRVSGVAFRLQFLLAFLLGATRSRRLGSIFRWAALVRPKISIKKTNKKINSKFRYLKIYVSLEF